MKNNYSIKLAEENRSHEKRMQILDLEDKENKIKNYLFN